MSFQNEEFLELSIQEDSAKIDFSTSVEIHTSLNDQLDLLIVIPVYNEAERIERNAAKITKYLENTDIFYKLVLAVDASPDNSVEVCEKMALNYENIEVKVASKKMGRGRAVRNAWMEFNSKYYGFIDADLSVGEDSILGGYRQLVSDSIDVLVGSRYAPGSKTQRPPLRKVVSFGYNAFLRLIFDDDINDHQCGLKMVSKEFRDSIIKYSRVDSWFWDSEILILANKQGYKVFELPVSWKETKYSRTSIRRLLHDVMLHGWGIIQLYKRLNAKHKKFPHKKEEILGSENKSAN